MRVMPRFWLLPIIVLAILATTSASTALASVTFDVMFDVTTNAIVHNPQDALGPGDEITLDIRIRSTGERIRGIGAAVYGYDSSVVNFVSGSVVEEFFFEECSVETGCSRSLVNSLSALSEGLLAGVGTYVQFLSANSTRGRIGTGELDPGLDGIVGGGDAQFRLHFRVVGVGAVFFRVGTGGGPTLGNGIFLEGGVIEHANTFVSIIPEPAVGWLVGIGLAGLAMIRTDRTGSRQAR